MDTIAIYLATKNDHAALTLFRLVKAQGFPQKNQNIIMTFIYSKLYVFIADFRIFRKELPNVTLRRV